MTKRRLVEGLWDCKYCNTTRIRGGLTECPNCAKARDEDTVFYLDHKKISYVPKKYSSHINRNPDWLCRYCDQLNSDSNDNCNYCGASRSLENLDYLQIRRQKVQDQLEKMEMNKEQEYEEKRSYSEVEYESISNNFYNTVNSVRQKKSFSFEKLFPYFPIILITILTFLGIIALISLFTPKEKDLIIQELSWNRCIDIQKYQTVEESDWSLPSGAHLLHTKEEVFDTEKVIDHYETKTREVEKERFIGTEEYVSGYRDLGNGYFEEIVETRDIYETYYVTETYEEPVYRDEPIYKTKYYYEIDKWVYERSVKTNGYDKEPYWGEYTLSLDERVSNKTESFHILGIDKDGNSESCSVSYEDWCLLEVGQTVKVKISFGHAEIIVE